jgi:hypothetical protein
LSRGVIRTRHHTLVDRLTDPHGLSVPSVVLRLLSRREGEPIDKVRLLSRLTTTAIKIDQDRHQAIEMSPKIDQVLGTVLTTVQSRRRILPRSDQHSPKSQAIVVPIVPSLRSETTMPCTRLLLYSYIKDTSTGCTFTFTWSISCMTIDTILNYLIF